MATVVDKSGNSPARASEPHKKSKQELIIEQLEIIAANTSA